MNLYKVYCWNEHDGTKFYVRAENEDEATEKAKDIIDMTRWDGFDVTFEMTY